MRKPYRIIDFKIEFGKFHDTIVLAGMKFPQIHADYGDMHSHEHLDKDPFPP